MTTDQPIGIKPRPARRGRPRTTGSVVCARCQQGAGKARVRWPEGPVCGPCYTTATRTHGPCPGCGASRLLPGLTGDAEPLCAVCAGLPQDFHCRRCGQETEFYRRGICARCALRDDLTAVLLSPADSPSPLAKLVEALCAAERPESIFIWKRSPQVQALFTALASGAVPLTHEGLDEHGHGHTVEHLRALLVHAGALPRRDPDLARFEHWIKAKLAALPAEVARPVERFATWHHLNRIRAKCEAGAPGRGPVNAAKQEITETIKFLTWLHDTHQRTACNCTQLDVDAWLASGPATRSAIRTFLVFARHTRINTRVQAQHRTARHSPALTQQQRLAWLNELLTGTSESLPYRVAGVLLLLYAQPLARVAALRASDVQTEDTQLRITLGKHPAVVPDPLAGLLLTHLHNRPNLRAGGGASSPWLFPGIRAGEHLHPHSIMLRLRALGINLLGARNRAISDLVTEVPPPLVADALGYSHQVAFKHAAAAAEPWARYAGRKTRHVLPVPRPTS
jgi:hypothetical protein